MSKANREMAQPLELAKIRFFVHSYVVYAHMYVVHIYVHSACKVTPVLSLMYLNAGLPDGIFSNQKSKFGKFWRVLQWKMLVYFMDIWPLLRPIGLFYAHLAYFMVIWYICPHFDMLYQEKSGNPDLK
jgi:hypothetical protein